MSNYVPTGVLDLAYLYFTREPEGPKEDGWLTKLYQYIEELGLKLEVAMMDPRVLKFMDDARINVEEAKIAVINEDNRRKEKGDMIKWGVVAALIGGGFLVLRKKK
jgi:hypothetical protein